MKRILVIFALAAAACGPAFSDILLLKNGVKYVGAISRPAPGKITVATKSGNLTFNDDQVNFKVCSYARPNNYDDAMDMLKRKEYAKALPLFQAWEKRYHELPAPYFADALHGMAVCLANTGKTAEAKALYEKLLEAFPESDYRSDAESWLIENEINRSSGPETEKKLRVLLASPRSSDSVRARIHSLLGKYFEKAGDTKQALEHYATIIVLYGDIEEFQKIAQYKCVELFGKCHRTNEAKFYAGQMLEAYGKPSAPKEKALTPEEKALCDTWAAMVVAAPSATPAATNAPTAKKAEAKDNGETKVKIGAKEIGAPTESTETASPTNTDEATSADSTASPTNTDEAASADNTASPTNTDEAASADGGASSNEPPSEPSAGSTEPGS